MQSYPLILKPTDSARTVDARANLFVYESAETVPSTGDARIIVKPDSGNEIILRPGQRFRPGVHATAWHIRALDPAVEISGSVIIGAGDFDDANQNNFVTIAASNVLNEAALPVQKQKLNAIENLVPVTINTGASQLLMSDPLVRVARIRNTHPTAALYIGALGVTPETAAIVVPGGATWLEEECAGAALYAVASVDGVSVAILGMKV